jgi:hypothetical protein
VLSANLRFCRLQSACNRRYCNLTKSLDAANLFLRLEALNSLKHSGDIVNDLLFIALTVTFFGVAILYLRGCEKLR